MSILAHGLRASAGNTGGVAIEFVGSSAQLYAKSSPTVTASLTSLTGGIASAPQSGDLVITSIGYANRANNDITCTTSGYTEIADLYANDRIDAKFAVFYKVLTSAETTVSFGGTSSTNSDIPVIIYVLRNVNQTTPLDVTPTTETGIDSAIPNCPSITTVTPNAMIVGFGGGASEAGIFNLTAPSGTENFIESDYITILGNFLLRSGAFSYLQETSGTYDPPAFGIIGDDSIRWSSAAVTIAIRPL